MNDEMIIDDMNKSSPRPLNDDSPRDHITSKEHKMTDHTEYDYVDVKTMDRGNEDYEGIYMMPYEMDLETRTANEYIDIINDPELCDSVHQTKAEDAKKCTESDNIEMYTSLSPRSTHGQSRAGNYQHFDKGFNCFLKPIP